MNRRVPALLVLMVAIIAVIAGTRSDLEAVTPTFSVSANGWMPSAPPVGGLTETWFCPGVPATGVDGVEGEILIANRTADRMVGSVLLVNTDNDTVRLALDVDGWASATVDVDEMLPGAVVGAVVEIDGGGAVVEQRSFHPAGDSQAACANATSDTWYLADGFTVEGSLDQVVLTNPFEQTVVANLEFATREGSRRPASYRGLTVPPRSVRVVDLGAPGAGAQSEPILAVSVAATRGRLVVGRVQTFSGGGRAGSQVTLASPALRDQWWFANGDKGPGVNERYSIYNPTDERVDVDVLFIGIDTPVLLDPITIEAHEVVTYDPGEESDLPDGRHAAVFATQSKPSIVVERAVTRATEGATATSVIAGATPRQDGFVATSWYVGISPDEPTEDALVVYNADNTAGTVTVLAVGQSGPVPVAGLEELELGAASIITIDLTDPVVLGRELIVQSTSRIFVERSFPDRSRRHPFVVVGRPGDLTSLIDRASMGRLLLAVAVVAVVAVIAEIVRTRRSADPPTQARHEIPAQLDRSEFDGEGWMVAVFTSATCSTCADVVRKAEVLRCDDVTVSNLSFQDHRRLHERYDIDAVPLLVIADGDGVVHAGFVGPVTATDLWAAIANAREPGSIEAGGCDRHEHTPPG